MSRLSDLVRPFVATTKQPVIEPELSLDESRLFRSLKTYGERASRGVDIVKHSFDVREGNACVLFRVVVEGRQSGMVINQLARRFSEHGLVESVEIVKLRGRSILTATVKR